MNNSIQPAGCPAPEDLAAFVDGRLDADRRAEIELHLAGCGVCREAVVDAVLLAGQALPTSRWSGRRRALAAGGALLALAASVMLLLRASPEFGAFPGRSPYPELVAAAGRDRTVEARLTGGFAYRPLRAVTRAGNANRSEDFDLLAATSAVQQRAIDTPTVANRHAAGIAQLLIGDYESAVATLEAVVAAEPGRAEYHSDLAAAYLARGRQWDRAEDFAKATAAAGRAIALDSSLDEAYFNQALALDAEGRVREAEAAYRRARDRDPGSAWSAEISTRLDQLRRR